MAEEKGTRKIITITDIPKEGETTIPKPTIGSLVPAINLKKVFKRIHNYIYANQGIPKDKAFEELLKLIFTKVFDERFNSSLQFYILPDETVAEAYERISKVFNNVQSQYRYIFKGNEIIELKHSVLKYVISELQKFSFVNTDTDIKGEAYEEIIGHNLRGDRGEFFTPRNVCKMTIEMLFSMFQKNKLTTPGAMKILDPAVGTGGFLIAGIQEIKKIFLERGTKQELIMDLVREISDANFFGIDFNPLLVRVSQMNMVMHGDGSSNMLHANSLEKSLNWSEDVKEKIKFGEFDIVITNPPFGSKIPIEPTILEQFELTTFGANNPRTLLPPEQLFIERCLDFLKPGGLLGIVLPDSILSNPGLIWVREWILKKSYIIASIDLPVETFEPHTGTQTSILILKKKSHHKQEKLMEEYDIFMAIPEKVGHDRRGNPIFKKTFEGEIEIATNGQPLIDDHLLLVSKTFKEWVRRKGMV